MPAVELPLQSAIVACPGKNTVWLERLIHRGGIREGCVYERPIVLNVVFAFQKGR